MLLLTLYNSVLKKGTSSDFVILPLLLLLFIYVFFECPRSLLRNYGGRSGTEPPHYISCLYLSYHFSISSTALTGKDRLVLVGRFKVQLSSIDISVMENGFQSNSVSDCGV